MKISKKQNDVDPLRKLIDIPRENKVLEKLQILAVKADTDLKNYIQDLLVEHVLGKK